jgi:hypothetical protein
MSRSVRQQAGCARLNEKYKLLTLKMMKKEKENERKKGRI